MNLLLVEDSTLKRDSIKSYLLQMYGAQISIADAENSHSALSLIESKQSELDVIILDMSLPTHVKGAREIDSHPNMYAGRDILSQMAFTGIVLPVIVMTMYDDFQHGDKNQTFDDLEKELMTDFNGILIGMIKYKSNSDVWKKKLSDMLKGLSV